MRVTLISKALVVGAYQRKCELLAAHPGVALTVLVPPSWGNQPLERAYANGYALQVIPIRFNGNFHLHYYPTLPRALAQLRPDVVHVDEEPYNLATWLAVKAARALRPSPRVVFFSWQNIRRRYPPPFSWMERSVLRTADAALVGSESACVVWRAKGFTRPIHVIPQFGVDEQTFAPPDERRNGEAFVVGYAGRLVREKGVDVLICAFARLPNSARLLIVGAGPELNALRALAQQLRVAERVTFCPSLPSTHMPEFYRALDAFVLPSRTLPNWKEQFGRVLVEAMACGVPVIASSCGEAPSVVGDAGLIFDEADDAALADCLTALMAQPDRRAELGRRGRARVLAHFTMRHIADRTVEVYRALCADAGR
ncbi:MAG: glycosyltransferase family 1 protein [Chloroflexi bacterium]|jgi:glycosyltransferase involved in cell wall biosynthesis|uniref:Glycosyl transferase family 1 n=1 Tax=Candidatus Thermofonsia Clade 3 bacterium TaxID=2364212 RepID=A0A2M8QDN9_9CHLR|nr:glycosyltransferase [Candidatus Roseilinea sp. NK_OTU-006]PJF47919.1 MAG: glycosyl transferase family 1 [Candidatus Thermofonsia Clade 3 bacterium]RMG64347.1 MAG: glycosyltransferase family 1 protein [Chloroflexota bacterium]